MKLIDKLLGRKYYAVIVSDRIHDHLCSTPFSNLRQVAEYKSKLLENRSVRYIATVSFRSRVVLDPLNL